MNKLITIIMPVKNGEKYLKETLEGIKNQNMNIEIILVNDASTDRTSEIAERYGCIILKNEISKGPVICKNQALNIASGEYIMFHDGDDVMNSGVLSILYNVLNSNPEMSAVQAKVKDFISPDIPDEEKQKTIIKKEPYYGLFTGAILMKKSVFDKIGLFNESVTAGEIIEWQTKMDKNDLKIKKLDLIATNRRIHLANFGKTQQKKEFKDYATLLRARMKSF